MERNYHKWYSPTLQRDMELLEFGHAGRPVLVFPTSRGRFYEYEDRGMIANISDKINAGQYRFYCVDSVDAESWYAYHKHPGAKVWRHVQYEEYLLKEVLPLLWSRTQGSLVVTGCSFGGYHCVNFALRHPDIVGYCVSMSGAFDLRMFMRGYSDQNFYLNQPLQFIPNLTEDRILSRYQQMGLVLATGEWDICLDENIRLSRVLSARNIPHYLDIWGNHTGHDWPWWKQMARKFF